MSRALLTIGLCVLAQVAAAQEVVPPVPIETPPANAPEGLSEPAEVVLLVTIGKDGTVHEVSVAQSAGQVLDAAAIAAVVRWTFKPATRDGQAEEARVRIPFRFVPGTQPSALTPTEAAQAAPPTSAAAVPTPPPTPPQPQVAGGEAPGSPSKPAENIEEVRVRGYQASVQRGGSDYVIDIGQLAVVPRRNAEELLKLAPGIFIANEGGEGHAEQVFLRGFEADSGSAIEFTVNGVPINEVDNPDAHGYADTHFIIPEVVKDLTVIEGPFDPHQGDFAVAGSARYELGVRDRGLRFSLSQGSYDTTRFLAIWAPKGEREGTFAAAQFWNSNGYGVNRASQSASAMGQYEGELGERGLYRVLASAYSTHYESAGVLRQDDVDSGRIGFYGTYDPSQGGDASRYLASFDLESPFGDGVATQQLFLSFRTLRIVENFTGFLLDPVVFGQSEHPQRGDATEKDYQALTAGARGSYRLRVPALGRDQAIEAGYYARYDHTQPLIQRLRFGTQIPYLTDLNYVTDIMNLAGYLDLDLHPLSFLTLRGGVRLESFSYNALNQCATQGNYKVGEPLDVDCPPYDASGPRSPTQRVTASGQILEPKATMLVGPFHGVNLTASYGQGAQSLDPTSIEQNENAPFVKLTAYEAGLIAQGRLGRFDWTARGLAYETKVSSDLIFNPDLGRLAPSSATTRTGFVGAARITSHFLDEAASFTTVHPTYDSDGTLVPYVPLVTARSDTALNEELPLLRPWGRAIHGELGLGLSYVGTRPLPLGQSAAPSFQVDASAALRYGPLKFGVEVTNLFNHQFALWESFYASDFHTRSYPTLAPAEHFTAAPPRLVLFTLTVALDREGD
ncbi:MAG TPA: TonB family protein [Anaeromyxobacteraceae bacterium]|nr:TonB family protein [Anaeromyxobacteraceae bacterium]